MKILLVADVGGHPKGYPNLKFRKDYYHVGDEAMLEITRDWYQNNPENKVTILSWKRKYKYSKTEPHFVWPTKRLVSRLYLPWYLLKVLSWRVLKVNFLSPTELRFIKLINSQDRIHFAGGGNITSLFPAWLSYCLFVVITGRFLGKKIIFTSQTIGPFKLVDKIIIGLVLNLADFIGLRQDLHFHNPLKESLIFLPKSVGMLDTAYQIKPKVNKPNQVKRIGISIHEERAQLILKIKKTLQINNRVTFVEIPHIVSSRGKTWKDIRAKTGKVDLLITSRYHGAVFALSQNIPCIALIPDEYYQIKMIGLLQMIYGSKNILDYCVDLRDSLTFDQSVGKILNLLKNLKYERRLLKNLNNKFADESRLYSFEKTMANMERLLEEPVRKFAWNTI